MKDSQEGEEDFHLKGEVFEEEIEADTEEKAEIQEKAEKHSEREQVNQLEDLQGIKGMEDMDKETKEEDIMFNLFFRDISYSYIIQKMPHYHKMIIMNYINVPLVFKFIKFIRNIKTPIGDNNW